MVTGRAPVVLLAAIGLAGCGLLSSDGALAPFPAEGIGDFGPSEPIELCLGTARVIPPAASTGAGAVCVAKGTTGKACHGDATCDGVERCICGRCIIEACQGASSCGDGRVCRDRRCTAQCTSDGDCVKGELCNAGGCARACSGDAACHHGERCDALDQVCVAKLCTDAIPCGPGDACEAVEVAGELHEPELAGDGAFVELRTIGAGATSSIYRARIDAPGRWAADPATPVLADPGEALGAPSALTDGETIDLYFSIGDGAAIGHARSTDGGKSFSRSSAKVLEPVDGWERGWIGSPAVATFHGKTYLFYEGGPGAGIGAATIEGGVARRLGARPIVTPAAVADPITWRDVGAVGAPYAVVAGDILRVYFTGRGVEGSDALIGDAATPADVNDSIGLAASRDGQSFSLYPAGPVFSRIANLRAYLGEREAAVRLRSSGAEIVFVAGDASGAVSGLGRAGK